MKKRCQHFCGIFVMIQAASEKLRAFSTWSYLNFVSEHDKMLTLFVCLCLCDPNFWTVIFGCIYCWWICSVNEFKYSFFFPLLSCIQLCKLVNLSHFMFVPDVVSSRSRAMIVFSLSHTQKMIAISAHRVGLRCHRWFSIFNFQFSIFELQLIENMSWINKSY